MKRIDFVYFEAGGGHRSAAIALKTVIEQQGRPWQVRLVNLQEVLDPLDIFRKYTRIRLQDIYNLLLRKGWTLGSAQLLAAMHGIIRLYHRGQVRLLRGFWADQRPDMVVSLVPNFNRAMFEALRALDPRIPYVTILTDFADYPPRFWIEPQPQHLICGTARAVQQALTLGHTGDRVLRASGMILRPGFYEPVKLDIGSERAGVGLRPDLPIGLVLFGGEGSSAMLQIAREIDRAAVPLQLIFICGKNSRLRARLESLRTRYPKHVVGFTSDIARYMAISDFFIGKAGPGSISEAVAMKLPVIVARNAWTLPQERYNADWVIEKDVGLVLRSFREIGRAVRQLLEPATLARVRANAAALDNRAVFEIPDMLESILEQ
ncbi:MAG TPA: glycosyltransferase [Bryobacteraceae bacterium]|nr:glycosyltransferase [Bryobacteraceae bacterium]